MSNAIKGYRKDTFRPCKFQKEKDVEVNECLYRLSNKHPICDQYMCGVLYKKDVPKGTPCNPCSLKKPLPEIALYTAILRTDFDVDKILDLKKKGKI